MCKHKSTTNLSNFVAKGSLGQLFAQAKIVNQINEQLQPILPKTLKSLKLCLIREDVGTLITNNPAVAFRAKQQSNEIIALLQTISQAGQISHIEIKVTANK